MELEERSEPQTEEAPNSVRAMLRERWEGIKPQSTVDREIPGVPGNVLQVRYTALPTEEITKLEKRAARAQGNAVSANADVLIRCCAGILVPVSADEEAPLDILVDDEGDPIAFDARLATFLNLGDEVDTARKVVYRLFSKAPQRDLAIATEAIQLFRWMRGGEASAAEQLLDF